MKIIKKLSNKPNAEFFCNCPACIDSQFEYGKSSVLIEDSDPLIYNFFGRELVK